MYIDYMICLYITCTNYISYISLLYIHENSHQFVHQNKAPSIRINAPPVEVVERFAEGHASVELQLLGAFCQSEVGKG